MYDNCWQKYEQEIAACLSSPRTITVDFHDTPLNLDYRVLRISSITDVADTQDKPKTFFRIAGIGCGWEWDEIGIFLATMGHTIVSLSWPGTGNSQDPPSWYYRDTQDFRVEANIAGQAIRHLKRQGEIQGQIIPYAHSMGCEIAAQMHHDNLALIEAMVFLAPSGMIQITDGWLGKIRQVSLWTCFGLCGGLHRLEWKLYNWYGRHTPIETFEQYVPPPRSSFDKQRRSQRQSEFRRNCQGNLPRLLATSQPIPVFGIWGTRDFVVPYRLNQPGLYAARGPAQFRLIPGAWHNVTMGPRSENIADYIHQFTYQV